MSKVLRLKILFQFLSFELLSIQCSDRWYGRGDASQIEGVHGMLMGIKALVHQIMY